MSGPGIGEVRRLVNPAECVHPHIERRERDGDVTWLCVACGNSTVDTAERERWNNRYVLALEIQLRDEQIDAATAYANGEGVIPEPPPPSARRSLSEVLSESDEPKGASNG